MDNIELSEEYNVEEVMSLVEHGRGNNKRILYLVKWLDYPECKDWTEEPFDNFSVGGLEKLQEFHQQNPDTPRDYWLTEGYTRFTKNLAVVGRRGGGLQSKMHTKTHFTDPPEKPLTGCLARTPETADVESQENRSEQTYRPLGDGLGPVELV